jgi:regulator of replication initiation timing
MGMENYVVVLFIFGSTHLFYRLLNNISSNFNSKISILINENTKLNIELKDIKERLTDLEAFRLKAYEKNLSMIDTRKWEENLDLDYDDDDDEHYDDDD